MSSCDSIIGLIPSALIVNNKPNTVKKWLYLIVVLLAGCNATTEQKSAVPRQTEKPVKMTRKTVEQLYLRGTFSLWNYLEEYQLQKISRDLYAASAQLEEGKHYEFMFSGKDASKANCGYLKPQDQWLKVGKTVNANCKNAVLQNFVFKPVVSGVYEFFIDFSRSNNPRVYVKKAY